MVKRTALILWGLLGAALAAPPPPVPPLQIHSSPSVAQAVTALIPTLREQGIEAKISGEASNGAAIIAVATEQADVAITTRQLTGEDQAQFPDKQMMEYRIGSKAVVIIVSRDVWDSGVRSISKDKLREIYEKKITNWKVLGGEDRPIKFYNSERGLGLWELFALWLYDELRKAPFGKFEILVSGDDARNTVEFNAGSITLAAPRWADNRAVFALALKDDRGVAIAPTEENMVTGTYPLARPLMAIFSARPATRRRAFLDFLWSPAAQDILEKNDLLRLSKPPEPQ